VNAVLGEVDKGYLEKVVGFPNAHFPSEYVFLVYCSEYRLMAHLFLQSCVHHQRVPCQTSQGHNTTTASLPGLERNALEDGYPRTLIFFIPLSHSHVLRLVRVHGFSHRLCPYISPRPPIHYPHSLPFFKC
jgi:hypothetical protein